MSIKRCPYCKAIIDDSAAYCSNCGTKLLFPEDELLEEDIPGEKILDNEPESEVLESDELDSVEEEADEEFLSDEELTDASGEIEEKEEETELPTEVESILEPENLDEPLLDLIEEEDESASGETEMPAEEETDELPARQEKSGGGIEDSVYHMSMGEDEEIDGEKEDTASKPLPEPPPGREDIQTDSQEFLSLEEEDEPEESEKREMDLEPDSEQEEKDASYDSGDQMSIFDPVEKEKEDIEQFLNTLKKERKNPASPPEDTGTGLPPWAKEISRDGTDEAEVSPDLERDEKRESGGEPQLELEPEPEAEAEIESEEIDEIEDRSTLREESSSWIKTDEDFDPPEDEETAEDMGLIPANPSEILRWIKCRFIDLLLVSGVWILTVWLASRMLGLSVFQLLSSSTEWMLILLGVFLLKYFFLFYFFLGETLGDRLFPRKD